MGDLSQRHLGSARAGQELNQAMSNSHRIRLCPLSARQSRNQRSQFLDSNVFRQLG